MVIDKYYLIAVGRYHLAIEGIVFCFCYGIESSCIEFRIKRFECVGPPYVYAHRRPSIDIALGCHAPHDTDSASDEIIDMIEAMPIYEYQCDDYGTKFEKLLRSMDAAQPDCPQCDSGNLTMQLSTFAAHSGSSAQASPALPPCASGACPTPGLCGRN